MSLPKRSLGMLLMALVTTAAGQASSLCAPLSEVTEAVLPTSAARPSAPNQRKRTVTRDRRIVSERIAVVGAKVITVDADNTVHTPGMVITEDGIIEYVGPPKELDSRTRKIDVGESWIIPGLVDLHTHIHGNGYNDMVQAVNPELRASPDFGQHNWYIKRGCAAGVTTLFGIPGSGTNMGGFGIIYKAKTSGGFDSCVVADPGGLKVAQDSNPNRYRNIWDIGISRAGMTWILSDVNDRAKAAVEQGRNDPALKWLKQVHSQELPVLIHTAGSEGVVNTARMWRVTYDTRAVLSHGSFDGWMVAEAVAKIGIPVNHGPRTIDYYSSRNGRINGSAAAYQAADPDNFSLNTDSGVVPQEEFFLQGSMGARYGGDGYGMLRALTIHPARAIGIDHRVGSLEVGKDADIVVRAGNPLDPRNPVELVLIDGEVHYDSEVDGQWF